MKFYCYEAQWHASGSPHTCAYRISSNLMAVFIQKTIKSSRWLNHLKHYSVRQYKHGKNASDDGIFSSFPRLNSSVESMHKLKIFCRRNWNLVCVNARRWNRRWNLSLFDYWCILTCKFRSPWLMYKHSKIYRSNFERECLHQWCQQMQTRYSLFLCVTPTWRDGSQTEECPEVDHDRNRLPGGSSRRFRE